MTEYDWTWLNMTEYAWIWLNMTKYDQIWLNMNEYGWIWLIMTKTEYDWIWLNMTEYDLNKINRKCSHEISARYKGCLIFSLYTFYYFFKCRLDCILAAMRDFHDYILTSDGYIFTLDDSILTCDDDLIWLSVTGSWPDM